MNYWQIKRLREPRAAYNAVNCTSHTHQIVHRVVRLDLCDLYEAPCECGHDVFHEVVPERDRLCLQHLLLLAMHLSQLRTLSEEQIAG